MDNGTNSTKFSGENVEQEIYLKENKIQQQVELFNLDEIEKYYKGVMANKAEIQRILKDLRKKNYMNGKSIEDYVVVAEITTNMSRVLFTREKSALPESISKPTNVIKILELPVTNMLASLREIEMLFSISHPNIIKPESIFFSLNQSTQVHNACMVMPYIEHDFVSWLFDKKEIHDRTELGKDFAGLQQMFQLQSSSRTVDNVLSELKQVLEGLQHLHNLGILHLDMKMRNILITCDDHAFITDFGLAKEISNLTSNNFGFSSGCSAPEILLYCLKKQTLPIDPNLDPHDFYSTAADIYSFGMILYYLFVGEFDEKNEIKIEFITKDRVAERIKTFFKKNQTEFTLFDEICEMIKNCLKYEKEQRPTAEELLKNQFHSSFKRHESKANFFE